MTVVGMSSLDKEREAYQRQRLRAAGAGREAPRRGARAGQDAAEVAPVTDAEYPELLAAVYKRSEVTKPRNMVGLAKDLPTKEMEDLLMASIPVDEESMRQLAVDRGAAVRDYLLAQKVPERAAVPRRGANQGRRRRLETRCRTETGDPLTRPAASR